VSVADVDGRVAESIEIAAAPQAVYAVIADVTGLPDWAAETVRCRWVEGATGASVGARFRGANRRGPVQWSTTSTVTAAEPGRAFGFRVTMGGFPVSDWRYDIEPAGAGSRVTESWRDLRPLPARVLGAFAIGVFDRPAHNRANMRRSLERLKQHLESAGTG
jgi:uncharacterized protein YndB with AHSA1/START domain